MSNFPEILLLDNRIIMIIIIEKIEL